MKSWKSVCLGVMVLAAVPLATLAEDLCVPRAAVEAVLEASANIPSTCGRTPECEQQQRAILDAALEQHPDDWFLRRAEANLLIPRQDEEPSEEFLALRQESFARLEQDPENPQLLDLAARVADGDDATLEHFQKATAAGPSFPWPHAALAILAFRADELKKAQEHAGHFLDLCPVRLDAVQRLARKVKDDAFWKERIARARQALNSVDPARVLDTYSAIWRLGFQVNAPDQFPRLREAVTADLERLETLDLKDRLLWLRTLKEGYELTSNTEGRDRIDARLAEIQPCSNTVIGKLEKEWNAEHPRPNDSTPEEEKQAYYRANLDFTGKIVEECPNAFILWIYRAQSAASAKPPAVDILRQSGDRLLELVEVQGIMMGRPMELIVADLLLQAEIDAERALQLAETGGPKMVELREEDLANEQLPESLREKMRGAVPLDDLGQTLRLAMAQTRTGRLEQSRASLTTARAQLHGLEEASEGNEELNANLPRWQGRVLQEEGELAAAEGRKQDAALYLHRAAGLMEKEELAERAATLWQEAGGSAAAWTVLARAAATVDAETTGGEAPSKSHWKAMDLELPPFALSDMKGKTWQLSHFEGKTVLANVWATWCGPCREELPYVQTLYEQLKDRDDIVVLTLNVDDNIGMITPYLEENGYTFPVLLALEYVEDVVGGLSIPRNWLVRGDGILLKEQTGFDPMESEENWVKSMTVLLERTAAGANPQT